MATFLELCQDLRRETGIAGRGPISVSDPNQPAQLERLIHWISNEYVKLQNRYVNWRWMRAQFTLTTVASQSVYTYPDAVDDLTGNPVDRFARWWADDFENPPTCYRQAAGKETEGYLCFMDWPIFRQIYDRGATQYGQPAHITIDPQNRLVLGPTPNDVYIIRGDYQRAAQILAEDNDVPELPARFHDLIVQMALKQYALFESAGEVLQRADDNIKTLMRQLEADQFPIPTLAYPMA